MTALEFIIEEISREDWWYLPKSMKLEIIKQAKEMEKEQIIEAHIEGFYSPPFRKSRNGEAELYYNETYKSE